MMSPASPPPPPSPPPPTPLAALASRPDLARAAGWLQRMQAALQIEPTYLGAAVVGSLAAGGGDALSDVDLVVYCQAASAAGLRDRLRPIAADRPVVHRFEGAHDAHSVFEKVILDDWFAYEVHFVEPTTRMRLQPPYLALVEAGQTLRQRESQDKPLGRGTLKPYAWGDAGLVWELFNCMKWLRRGETDDAAAFLRRLGEAIATQRPPER